MKFLKQLLCLSSFVLMSSSASAEEISEKDYILGNTLLTLYHEFGHGLVSELGLPVLGREEDAVDTFSVITVTDKLNDAERYNDQQAADLDTYLWVTADVWLAFADTEEPDEYAYASEHSLDLQRFYSHVCLVYGSDPEFHQSFVDDLEIDPELVEGCEERYDIAYEDWQIMLGAEDEQQASKINIKIDQGQNKAHRQFASWLKNWPWLADFEQSMEQLVELPEPVDVVFTSCDEENAFWDPQDRQVTFCYELMDLYARFYQSAD